MEKILIKENYLKQLFFASIFLPKFCPFSIFFTRSYSNQRIEVLRSVQVALQLLFTKAYSIESHSYYKTTIPGWVGGWVVGWVGGWVGG